jgi:hypothetical protein
MPDDFLAVNLFRSDSKRSENGNTEGAEEKTTQNNDDITKQPMIPR